MLKTYTFSITLDELEARRAEEKAAYEAEKAERIAARKAEEEEEAKLRAEMAPYIVKTID